MERIEELKATQKELMDQLNEIGNAINQLLKDARVKDYVEKQNLWDKLMPKYQKIQLEILKEEMKTCNHIWIKSEINRVWDGHRTDKEEYHTCIKCGLDTHAIDRLYGRTIVAPLDNIMYSLLQEARFRRNGIDTDIICSYELARGIYDGIRKEHPDITDEQAVRYLKWSLRNIRTNKVTDGVKENRIKRLKLEPNFKQWNQSDVISSN